MRVDILGNPVIAGDEATLAAIVDFVEGFLAWEERAHTTPIGVPA